MNFEDRVKNVKLIVSKHFNYKESDTFIDKLPRNKRTGVRLARIKFAFFDTDSQDFREMLEVRVRDHLYQTDLQVESVNSFRSYAMLTNKAYDSLIVHIVVDKY